MQEVLSSDNSEVKELMEAKEYVSSSGYILPYRIYIPKNNKKYKYPLVTFFHGLGECGKDNEQQLLDRFIFLKRILNSKNLSKYPSIILAPQCSYDSTWVNLEWFNNENYDVNKIEISQSLKAYIELLDKLLKEYNIDEDRLYITGLSLGGGATLDLLARYPNKFACGVAICPCIIPIPNAKNYDKANLWVFHGLLDTVCHYSISTKLKEAIDQNGCLSHLTLYPLGNHGTAWVWGYSNEMLLDYMFESKRAKNNKYLLNNDFIKDINE